MDYTAAIAQPYTQTEILHFADGTSGIHTTKSVRRFAFNAVTGPCSAYHLASWQDINPSIIGVTFQYDPA